MLDSEEYDAFANIPQANRKLENLEFVHHDEIACA